MKQRSKPRKLAARTTEVCMNSSSFPAEPSSKEISRISWSSWAWARAMPYNSALAMATAPKPARAETRVLSSCVNGLVETGIDQNRAVRARGAKGRGDENSGRRIFSEMRSAVDADRDALAGGDGAGGDLERRAEVVLLETRTDGESKLRSLGRHRLQLEQFLLLDEDEHGGRMQQHAEAVGDALHHGGGVGQAMQGGGDLDQNAGAAVLFAGKLVQAEGFECGAELGRQDGDFGQGIVVEAGSRARSSGR